MNSKLQNKVSKKEIKRLKTQLNDDQLKEVKPTMKNNEKKGLRIPALPADEAGEAAEFPSRAVAPPNRMSRGPIYPGVPSSPTGATEVSVWPHLDPGPSSFFSMLAFMTEYDGAGRGPVMEGESCCCCSNDCC